MVPSPKVTKRLTNKITIKTQILHDTKNWNKPFLKFYSKPKILRENSLEEALKTRTVFLLTGKEILTKVFPLEIKNKQKTEFLFFESLLIRKWFKNCHL